MKELKDLNLKDLSKVSEMKNEDLISEIKSAEKKMFELKMKKELNELKQTHLIKFLRRYIARANTIASNKWIFLS